jgi:hypothetical protein
MAKNPRAGVDIVVNEKPAQAGLRALQDSFTSTIVSLNAAMEVSSKVFGAANAVISAVVDSMSEYVELAMEQERVERRAIAAIQSKIAFTRDEFNALQAANAARQQQLGIGDEVQLQLQGTLATMGVAKGQIDAATKAAIGLSEAMGMGLEEAGKLAAKAFTGNVAALAEFGIKATSAADAQRQLGELFAVAVSQSSSLATRYQVLTANIGDLKEVLGQTVTSSGVAKDALDALSAATVQLQTFFASSDGKQLVNQFFSVITIGAADAIDAMIGAYRVMQSLRGESDRGSMLSRIGGAGRLLEAANPFALVARGLGLGGGIEGGAKEIKDAFDQLLGRGVEALGDSPLVQTASDLADRLRAAAKSLVEIQSGLGAGGGAGGRGVGGGGARGPALGELTGTMTIESPEQVQLRKLEAEIGEHMAVEAGLRAAAADYQRQILIEQADITRQVEMEKLDERNAAVLQKTQEHVELMKSVANQSASIMGNQIAGMVTAVVTGDKSMGEALRSFVGGIVTNLGMMLIQMGSAAVALNLLSVVPVLGKLVGAPGMGVGAGLAAIGIGAGMVALGSAMGGSRGAGSAAATPSSSGGPSSMGDPFPRGFSESASTAAAPSYNVSVSFGVVGDERRAARMIRDVLERGR